jgi:two-component system, chemotaxis family, chemotaxis protein CheY
MNDDLIADLHVLIVDDNNHMRRLLRGILEGLGIVHIQDVENGVVALNQSRLNIPDIIITDMMMTPIDGLEFARLLRDDPTHPATGVPVVMVTGYAEKQLVESARDAGITEFRAKAVTVDGAEARLRSVVENPRQFIRSSAFVGHDRRRRQVSLADYAKRRAEDQAANTAFLAGPGHRFEDVPLEEVPPHIEVTAEPYEPEIVKPKFRRALR